MPETIQYAQPLRISEGWLCLDYVNIIGWLIEHGNQGTPFHPTHLLAWARRCHAISPAETDAIRAVILNHPDQADALIQTATELRHALNRLASNESPTNSDVDVLNETLTEAMAHAHLIHRDDNYIWTWTDTDLVTRPLWSVARSAAALLTSDEVNRVGRCDNDECGFLYLDVSKNRSRRWCSMKTCGNVAKARRHYAKQRQHK